MTTPARGPDLRTLLGLFAATDDVAAFDVIPADEVPQPEYHLLVHDQHMTVTVEAHHGDRVVTHILECRSDGDSYARKVLLCLEHNHKVVQYGIVRVDLSVCSPAVRAEIVGGRTPFGRILIEHNVLRRIELTAYLRVSPGPAMMEWFGMAQARPVYGRLAIIHYAERPAVELVEIVAPS